MDIESISKKEHVEKERLKEEAEDYYIEKSKELRLKDLTRFKKYFPEPSENMKKDIAFAHKDIDKIATAIVSKKPWAVVSGLNPSGPLHFGHKTIFDELLWLQKHGAEIFIPLTNDESYIVDKTKTLAESRKIAYESVMPSIIAMGFDPEKTHIFVDSDYPDIYNVAMQLSKQLKISKIRSLFGFKDSDNVGSLFYRGAVQVSQILLPQYIEFNGPIITLIPIGIDQHPYILLARDIAKKNDMLPPAELIMKFLPGLLGAGGKMSASIKGSSIFLTDDIKEAKDKIKKAYTGGIMSSKYQKELGGVPEVCSIFLLQKYHFLNQEEAVELNIKCRSGLVLCSECKKCTNVFVENYLKDHKEKFEKAKTEIPKFLLKKRITSILE